MSSRNDDKNLITDNLKPCPFCGSVYLSFCDDWDCTLGIYCRKCKSLVILDANSLKRDTPEARKRAIEAWNQRVLVVEATLRYTDDADDTDI